MAKLEGWKNPEHIKYIREKLLSKSSIKDHDVSKNIWRAEKGKWKTCPNCGGTGRVKNR